VVAGSGFGCSWRNEKKAALARVRRVWEQFQSELSSISGGGIREYPRVNGVNTLPSYDPCYGGMVTCQERGYRGNVSVNWMNIWLDDDRKYKDQEASTVMKKNLRASI